MYVPPLEVRNTVFPLLDQPLFPVFIVSPKTESATSCLVATLSISFGSTSEIPSAKPAEKPVRANFMFCCENPVKPSS